MKKNVITNSTAETKQLGVSLGLSLRGGELILLSGDLGAGKTTLVQGLAKGMGVTTRVNSPTFNILRVYKARRLVNVKALYHIDAYRLKSLSDLIAIGLNEFLADKQAVVVIEWPENVKGLEKKSSITINIKHAGDEKRQFIISSH